MLEIKSRHLTWGGPRTQSFPINVLCFDTIYFLLKNYAMLKESKSLFMEESVLFILQVFNIKSIKQKFAWLFF